MKYVWILKGRKWRGNADSQELELRSQSGSLAQFVGSYPVKRTVSFNWYRLNTICIARVLTALTQQVESIILQVFH